MNLCKIEIQSNIEAVSSQSRNLVVFDNANKDKRSFDSENYNSMQLKPKPRAIFSILKTLRQ